MARTSIHCMSLWVTISVAFFILLGSKVLPVHYNMLVATVLAIFSMPAGIQSCAIITGPKLEVRCCGLACLTRCQYFKISNLIGCSIQLAASTQTPMIACINGFKSCRVETMSNVCERSHTCRPHVLIHYHPYLLRPFFQRHIIVSQYTRLAILCEAVEGATRAHV